MKDYEKTIYLYNDNIGRVDYVEHMGNDLTVVNSARVSFGKQKEEIDEKDKNSSNTSSNTDIHLLLNITLLLFVLSYLFLCVASIIVIELGLTMKFLADDIQI